MGVPLAAKCKQGWRGTKLVINQMKLSSNLIPRIENGRSSNFEKINLAFLVSMCLYKIYVHGTLSWTSVLFTVLMQCLSQANVTKTSLHNDVWNICMM